MTVTTVGTSPLFDLMTDLAGCLCAQIVVDGSPDVCFCGVVPGEVAAQDYAGDCDTACGMAWVRLASLYAVKVIGVPDLTQGNCGSSTGADLELGVMRCLSVGNADGSPPSDAELLAATQLQIADAMSMQRAIRCCSTINPRDIMVGQYVPLGPEGGLVGGTLTVSIAVG